MSLRLAREHGIENPNTSGQGFHPRHHINPFHSTLRSDGYLYSHSVAVINEGLSAMRGREVSYLMHCFKRQGLNGKTHNVSVYSHPLDKTWQWQAHYTGSARYTTGASDTKLHEYVTRATKRERSQARHASN